MFVDYISGFDEVKKLSSKVSKHELLRVFASKGVDHTNFESLYKWEIQNAMKLKDPFPAFRLNAELEWHRSMRPYFNIYPVIESKLLELTDEIQFQELNLPFKSLEIRTSLATFLFSDTGDAFMIVAESRSKGPSGTSRYQEFLLRKQETLKAVIDGEYRELSVSDWPSVSGSVRSLSEQERNRLVRIAAGTCMLAADRSIVTPVILKNHQKNSMTPAEVAEYAQKAINRTGRIGFEVGREIEKMKATAHYRNGHFAKFHVGKTHDCYPKNATVDKVPIIKWRSGAIVNADNVPKVPTGFHDKENQTN